ncbi:MAG: rRNA maturation RNase YbeY [Candidatus Binataceae bacterium]
MPVELRCETARARKYANVLCEGAAKLLGAAGLSDWEISLVLTNDQKVRELNRQFRGIDRPTDVLSFPQVDDESAALPRPFERGRVSLTTEITPDRTLGDVVISVDTAMRQSVRRGISAERRLDELLVHGFLHLLGYDHARSQAEADRMFARESESLVLLGYTMDGAPENARDGNGLRGNRPIKSMLPHFPATAMLTHFTRRMRENSALDNLVAILREGTVRAATRMIRGKRPAVCLFDASLIELRELLHRRNRRRYEPFGIAVDKRYAFSMGARPVIYLPWREARELLPPEELWRVGAMDMERTAPVDWSFEREWRTAGDLALEADSLVALVESWRDADEIYDRFDGQPPCAGIIPLSELFGTQ